LSRSKSVHGDSHYFIFLTIHRVCRRILMTHSLPQRMGTHRPVVWPSYQKEGCRAKHGVGQDGSPFPQVFPRRETGRTLCTYPKYELVGAHVYCAHARRSIERSCSDQTLRCIQGSIKFQLSFASTKTAGTATGFEIAQNPSFPLVQPERRNGSKFESLSTRARCVNHEAVDSTCW